MLKNPLRWTIFVWRGEPKTKATLRTVEYADCKVGLFYISPFDLLVEGEPVITKLEKKESRSVSKLGAWSISAKTITNGSPNLRSVGQGALIQQRFGRFSDLTIRIETFNS